MEVFKSVGETILGDPDPQLVGEVGFLEAGATPDHEGGDAVGRIDLVLVGNNTIAGAPMAWTAVEIQAVYFSGNAMQGEFEAFNDAAVDWVIFPVDATELQRQNRRIERLKAQGVTRSTVLVHNDCQMALEGFRPYLVDPANADTLTSLVTQLQGGKTPTNVAQVRRLSPFQRTV